MRGGKRIIATGSYTNSTDGPGILMEYDEKKEILKVSFANLENHWEAKVSLPKYSWCHVAATWNSDPKRGLRVVLDGKPTHPRYVGEDKKGKYKLSRNEKYIKFELFFISFGFVQ